MSEVTNMLVRSESEGVKEGKIILIVTEKDAKTKTNNIRKHAEDNWYWTDRSFLLGNNFITLAFADCLSLLVVRKKRKENAMCSRSMAYSVFAPLDFLTVSQLCIVILATDFAAVSICAEINNNTYLLLLIS